MVTNAKKIECIRSVLTTTEATANKVAGANASALISGAQTSANAQAAAPEPVVKDNAKQHNATRTAKQPKPRGGREQNQQQKPHHSGKGKRKNSHAFDREIDGN